MSTTAPDPTSSLPDTRRNPQDVRRAVWAGGVGNFVEQFEAGLYGYMAPVLAPVFFPESSTVAGVLGTFGILAIACLFRPVGGTLIGRFGDRIGRRATLLWTIVAMGVITALIGCLPDYNTFGVGAVLLLLLLRILQGVISGGEYVGAVAFVVEWAEPHRRAYYTSFASISCFVGILGGAGVAALVTAVFDPATLTAWGWRIPFLAVLPLALVGVWLRSRTTETPEFQEATASGQNVSTSPIREALRTQWRPMLTFCGVSVSLAVLSYTWVTFYPEYLTNNLNMSHSTALVSNAISVAVLIALLPLAGKLADHYGRRPMLMIGYTCTIVLVPLAFMVAEQGTFVAALVGQLIYIIPEFFLTGVVTVCAAELFATRTRFSASAIAYNSSFSVFMGFTPFMAAGLVALSGTIYAVWGLLATVALIALIVVIRVMPETAYRPAQRGAASSV